MSSVQVYRKASSASLEHARGRGFETVPGGLLLDQKTASSHCQSKGRLSPETQSDNKKKPGSRGGASPGAAPKAQSAYRQSTHSMGSEESGEGRIIIVVLGAGASPGQGREVACLVGGVVWQIKYTSEGGRSSWEARRHFW